jgi:hypothetical protein
LIIQTARYLRTTGQNTIENIEGIDNSMRETNSTPEPDPSNDGKENIYPVERGYINPTEMDGPSCAEEDSDPGTILQDRKLAEDYLQP